jgi:hypothetical protein
MTERRPPRLALWILRRVLPDNESLAGDLVEMFAARRSRLWFCWQVVSAIAVHMLERPGEVRPLKLTTGESRLEHLRLRTAPFKTVNLTASPIDGVGGLGLALLGALVCAVRPEAWWIVISGVVGGVVLGVLLVLIRRREKLRT